MRWMMARLMTTVSMTLTAMIAEQKD